ncbi:MAG: CaiB/BaiF family protein [Acidimicrobiales bacterium]|nr:CaiB/BaiF family protein [Acidimicrobiales bacterium]
MTGIMSGVRVVEVASWTFVPAAGAVLAEWGADVIKVEHPVTGDPQRGLSAMGLVPTGPGGVDYMIELPNRGKRSVGIDLKSPEGREALLKLVATADVFLTNYLPALRQRLGLEVEDLRAVNPNLIYVRGSGHGERGPEREKGAYDGSTFWGRVIAAQATPSDREWPLNQPFAAFGDLMGGLTIAGGISAALFHRERTGEATVVDASLLGLGMWATGANILAAGLFGMTQVPGGSRDQMPNPLVNMYRTKDARFLTLMMLQSDVFWPDLMNVIGHPELVDDPRFKDAAARFENRRECIATLDAIFAEKTFDEWRDLLSEAKGVWEPVETPGELIEDPQALANGYVREIQLANGTSFRIVPSPLQFNETPPDLTPAPGHGEHTDEVLQSLGYDMEELIKLKVKGAIL